MCIAHKHTLTQRKRKKTFYVMMLLYEIVVRDSMLFTLNVLSLMVFVVLQHSGVFYSSHFSLVENG